MSYTPPSGGSSSRIVSPLSLSQETNHNNSSSSSGSSNGTNSANSASVSNMSSRSRSNSSNSSSKQPGSNVIYSECDGADTIKQTTLSPSPLSSTSTSTNFKALFNTFESYSTSSPSSPSTKNNNSTTIELLNNITNQTLSPSQPIKITTSKSFIHRSSTNNTPTSSSSSTSSASFGPGGKSPVLMSKQDALREDNETINLLDSIVNLSTLSISASPTIISVSPTSSQLPSPILQASTLNDSDTSSSEIISPDHISQSSTPTLSSTSLVGSPLLYSTMSNTSSRSNNSASNSPLVASSSNQSISSSTNSVASSNSNRSGTITPDRAKASKLNLNSSSSSTSNNGGIESPRISSPQLLNNSAGSIATSTSGTRIFTPPPAPGTSTPSSSSSPSTYKPLVVKINRESSSHSIWKTTLSGTGKEEHVKVCFDEVPGRRLIQRVSIDLTPLEIKRQLLEEIGPEFLQLIDQFELKVLSINATFTNESLPLRRQLIMQACNISRLFPKMQLTLKNSNDIKLPDNELVDLKGHIQTELEIFELTGNGLTRILDAGGQEVSGFRKDLAHLRLQRDDDDCDNSLLQYVYVLAEPMPLIVPPKVTIQATYGSEVKINKRLDVAPTTSIDDLKSQIFKKYALVDRNNTRDKSPSDYVIKVTGFREYILSMTDLAGASKVRDRFQPTGKDGDFALIDYDYIRQCISKQQVIELTFTDNSVIKQASATRHEEHQVSFIDKLLDTTDFDSDDESTNVNINEKQSNEEGIAAASTLVDESQPSSSPSNSSQLPNSSSLPFASQQQLGGMNNVGSKLPITKVNRLFRVKVVGLRNINLSASEDAKTKFVDNDRQPYCYVMVELYHGGQLLANATFTPTTAISNMDSLHFPDWDRDVWTPFSIPIRSLPRATRACFTVFITGGAADSSSDASTAKSIPLGWASCQLMDHKGYLRTGPVAFKLWEDGRANPIGTCIDNVGAKTPIILLVEFETFVKPIVFTQSLESIIMKSQQQAESPKRLEPSEARRLNGLIQSDPLVILTPDDKRLIYAYRHIYTSKPKALAKFLTSVNWVDQDQVAEAYRLMGEWAALKPVQALELLDAKFADGEVRSFATQTLKQFSDAEFSDYLLQLTQVLKYEPYHKSELSHMLIERALANRSRIGHSFFWFLKAEMHTPEIEERYGLLLEGYLRSCGSHRQELIKQNQVIKSLYQVAMAVKQTHGASERKKVLLEALAKIKFPDTFQLPLDPRWEAKGLIVDKCRYMDSKKLPLWLVFENVEQHAKPLTVIFKVGDDLRQDILTLQILRIMDKFWKSGGLDLRLQPYKCVSTGDGIGMLEVVLNANTIANINKDAGGTSALLEEKTLVNWLREFNPTEQDYNKAVETFILSCAGYVVATYVMGIGDRHADNIMITRSGHLFHIDFGHFLGNYKKKYGFKRERAPFIFTHQYMAIVGGKDSDNFKFFVNTCCLAYNILRKNSDLFINLFQLMLSTGIPELQCPEDIDYLRKALAPEMTDTEAAEEFTKNIIVALNTKTVLLNDIFHNFAHR